MLDPPLNRVLQFCLCIWGSALKVWPPGEMRSAFGEASLR